MALEALAEKRLTKVCSSAIWAFFLALSAVLARARLAGGGHVLVVVAGVDAQLAVVQVGHVGADAVQEVPVVGDDDHGAVARVQHLFQPPDGVDVQVVGGLVEQQDVRIGEQRLGEQHAQLPARRHRAHGALVLLQRNIQPEQQLAGAGLGGVAVQLGEVHLQVRDLHAVFLAHLRQRVDAVALLLDPPQLVVAHDDGIQHRVVLEGELVLAQLAEALAGLHRHVARAGLQIAAQDLHQGGFSTAVGADQAVAIAAAELDGDVLEQRLAAELHGDVGRGNQNRVPQKA